MTLNVTDQRYTVFTPKMTLFNAYFLAQVYSVITLGTTQWPSPWLGSLPSWAV